MYSQEFVQLVMGDRSMYPVPYNYPRETLDEIFMEHAGQYLISKGYLITNLPELARLSPDARAELVEHFNPEKKAGYILRKTFANKQSLQPYTPQEWMAILAQYSMTYGWVDTFEELVGEAAYKVYGDYMGDKDEIYQILEEAKDIRIGWRENVVDLIQEILESKTVLRTHQRKTIEACPVDVLEDAFADAKITINETRNLAIRNLRGHVSGVFKYPTDVLRYIISVYADEPFEGQITKPDLKFRHIHIPTSDRKFLLNELNHMGNAKRMCEDMFTFDTYWKIIGRYLRYGKMATSRKRYPVWHQALDLLYENDRSWTFNGRYSAALEANDYAAALDIARERSGFLLRNMLMFLRYPKGTEIATTVYGKTADKVKTDNIAYFTGPEFRKFIKASNPKLSMQLIAELEPDSVLKSIQSRMVQGMRKHYAVPMPGVKAHIRDSVMTNIRQGLSDRLREQNKPAGKVYFDPALANVMLAWSGRKNTEINYSGEFLSPGSLIDIPNSPMIRLGVIWRGNSTDIDHNVSLYDANGYKVRDVYYGDPEYSNWISSSGDITHCDFERFSAEFIDIDLTAMPTKNRHVSQMVSSLISYSGYPRTIGSIECYLFIKCIRREDRIMRGRSFTIDLMDTDYAMRLDPDNVDNSVDYVGFHVDIPTRKIKVVGMSGGDKNRSYGNVTSKDYLAQIPELLGNQMTLLEGLEMAFDPTQVVTDPVDADLIFGDAGLDPNTEMERIQRYLF